MNKKKGKKNIIVYPENCTGCLTCQLRCSIKWQESFNPAASFIQVVPGPNGFDFLISYSEDCHKCLNCARHCPYEALEVEGKGEEAYEIQ